MQAVMAPSARTNWGGSGPKHNVCEGHISGAMDRSVNTDLSITRSKTTMSGFDDREKGFEKKFAHDAELKFKAEAR
ncbi:MAG: ATPase inhibitor subunit zeta, partial [Hyphomicrobiaceae bacterium]